jgi:hypothetical protein
MGCCLLAAAVSMAGCAVDERGIAWVRSDGGGGDSGSGGTGGSGGAGGTGGSAGAGGRGGAGGLDGPRADRDDPDTSYSLDVPMQAYQDGWPCTGSDSCASGFCVDNVCCQSACSGTCMGCARSKTGRPDGQCQPLPSGQDPDEECPLDATVCGRTGVCNGGGGCAMAAAGLTCGPSSCSGNVLTPPPRCNGSGGCQTQPFLACAGYLRCADAITCKGTCAGADDCVRGSQCDTSTGQCSAPKDVGAACDPSEQGRDCATGNCVDGVCCDAECNGNCQACVEAKTGAANGTCAPITAGTDPDAECEDDGPGECGDDGTCDGAGACRQYPDGTLCDTQCCGSGGNRLCEFACRLGSCEEADRIQCGGLGGCCCDEPVGGGGPACATGLQCVGGCN